MQCVAQDIQLMASAGTANLDETILDALKLFLSGRWSKMTNFQILVLYNAIGQWQNSGQELNPSLRIVQTTFSLLRKIQAVISNEKECCLETYSPIYHAKPNPSVYALKQPVAKASFKGLSLSAYDAVLAELPRFEPSIIAARSGFVSCFAS